MEFADKLKYVRNELGLTQGELAEKLSVSFATINRWENGKFDPNYRTAKKFEEFCVENNIDFAEGK